VSVGANEPNLSRSTRVVGLIASSKFLLDRLAGVTGLVQSPTPVTVTAF